jgi:hypothetical protein
VLRVVVVQAFVAGLQLNAPQAVSFEAVHCTQVPEEQTPFPPIALQSASTEQGPQTFVIVLQSDAVESLQSVFPRQATQELVAVLQTGFVASVVQSAVDVHSTHVFEAEQTGFADDVQSAFFRHATHVSVAVSQTDVAPEHFPLQGSPVAPPADVPPIYDPALLVAPPFPEPPLPPTLSAEQVPLLEQSSARLPQPIDRLHPTNEIAASIRVWINILICVLPTRNC